MLFLEKVKEKIKSFSLDQQPKEACGFVFEKNNVIDVFPCRNFSENPTTNFSISPKDYLKALRLGKIIAVYHSHTDGTKDFSSYDLINSLGHSLIFILYDVIEDSFSIFDPEKEKTYICDEPFRMGTSDCYNFVVSYYNNLNITLEDPRKAEKKIGMRSNPT
jgi:proteasome lid subunit RPN8/RPN11